MVSRIQHYTNMKINLSENRLRIRLNEAELRTFVNDKVLQECFKFGGESELKFTLKAGDTERLHAEYSSNQILVTFPASQLKKLNKSVNVSIENKSTDPHQLKIRIETESSSSHQADSDKKSGSGPKHPLLIDIIE